MKQVSVPLVLAFALAMSLAGCLGAAPLDPIPGPDEADRWSSLDLPDGTPLARAVAALRTADESLLGPIPAAEVAPGEVSLATAVFELARAHGHEPSLEEILAIATLHQVPPETAQALVGVIDAFRHLEQTTLETYRDAAGPDRARIAGAQHAVADTAVLLEKTLATFGTGTAKSTPITVGTVLALDLDGFDDTYSQPFMLIIETGGHETYRNNAGGNAFSTQHCSSDPDIVPRVPTAAALIDLAGNDQYRPGRDCGTNGGGAYGVGMLIDNGGNDVYASRGLGTNGGGYAYGQGLLLDAGGSDVYTATGAGATGGGYAGGVGRLIDLTGSDSYTATGFGANGGARGAWHCVNTCQEAKVSSGLLLDLGGTDIYDDLVVRGTDRTVVPKEHTGMQIDVVVTV